MTINTKIIEAQNLWALENSDNPYRTAKMDLDLWKSKGPENYTNAQTICDKDININHGKYWDQHYDSWASFCADEKNVWPIDKFEKDLNTNKRPQRPFDQKHLNQDLIKHHDGIFNHALAGPIDVAIRSDGSISVWDHWHTVLFAKMCGITHLRINKITHDKKLTLEECRAVECDLYFSKNGLCKKSSAEDTFEKSSAVAKSKGETSLTNPDIALSNIYDKLLLSPTGKNPNYRHLNGVSVIKTVRASLIKQYGNTVDADAKIELYLTLLRDSFNTGPISGYFFLGIVHFMNKFQTKYANLDFPLTVNNLSVMFKELQAGGKTQEDFIATAKNQKGLPAESISMRIANFWSKWMKSSGKSSRGPITLPAAIAAYGEDLPEMEIKTQFQSKEASAQVQCPVCQNMHKVKVSELADAA